MTVWPLAVYFGIVLFIVTTMIAVSSVLGQRHSEPATRTPFESGIVSTGSAHVRLSVKFYLIAMFFVVFDLEAVFVFLWAVGGRELGWAGYGEVLIFIGVLAVTLAYLWRTGALDWYAPGSRANTRERS
ncbi:MAG: NADH-quinone oxidoreductase subunit A [Acidobacteriaceae bacterium]